MYLESVVSSAVCAVFMDKRFTAVSCDKFASLRILQQEQSEPSTWNLRFLDTYLLGLVTGSLVASARFSSYFWFGHCLSGYCGCMHYSIVSCLAARAIVVVIVCCGCGWVVEFGC